ncbi:hypothetical protein DIPPA_31677 [Diplonema papillatum]|nr:hypothetical protein DIPPA_31677 [Diplonema papillatum]
MTTGIRNVAYSALVLAYARANPLAAELIRYVRMWAAQTHLHPHLLTDDVLHVMVLHFLVMSGTVEWIDPEEHIDIVANPPLPSPMRVAFPLMRPAAVPELRKLFAACFRFYASFDYDSAVISLASRHPVNKSHARYARASSGALHVESLLSSSENLAVHITSEHFSFVMDTIHSTLAVLTAE